MSSYSDLASQIINKKGAGGRFSGLNTFLDVKQAFDEATRKYQMESSLKKQESQSEAAKGIAQAGLISGVTPDVSTAMGQYNSMTGGNIATGMPTAQPTTPSMQMQDNSGSINKTITNTDTGFILTAKPPKELQINPEDKNTTWDGSPVSQGYKGANLQTRAFNQFTNNVNTYMKSKSNQVGALNAQVDQAIKTQKLIDQYYNPSTKQYDVPPNKFYELSTGVAKLLNPTGVLTNEQINGVNQASAQGDFGKALTWATGKLHNGSSQDIIKDTVSTIQREGTIAEDLRNKDLDNLKQQVPPKLSVAAAKQILNSVAPNSYKEYLNTKASGVEYGGIANEQSSKNSNRVGKYTFQ